MEEIKIVPGFNGLYSASTAGYLISNPREVWNGVRYFTKKSKIIVGTPRKDGYLDVNLKCEDGAYRHFLLHRIIARTFISESDMEVNHKDFAKTNNSVENLEYVSRRDNIIHYQNSISSRSSQFIGVSWRKKDGKWCSNIRTNGKKKWLGLFDTEELASIAYNYALSKEVLDSK